MFINNIEQQRAQILRQQQATPQLNKLVHLSTDLEADMNDQMKSESRWDYGTADEFNNNMNNTLGLQYRSDTNQEFLLNQTDYSMSMSPSNNTQLLNNTAMNNVTMMSTSQNEPNSTYIASRDEKELTKENPQWIPDDQATSCTKCKKDFSMFFRRHHCRICKRVFCKNCSDSKIMKVEGEKKTEKKRACKACIKQDADFSGTLNSQKQLLTDQISQLERYAQSDHFSNILGENRPTTPMEINRLDGENPDFFVNRFIADTSPEVANDQFNQKREHFFSTYFKDDPRKSGQLSMIDEMSAMSGDFSSRASLNREEKLKERTRMVSMRSTIHKRAMNNYLRQANMADDSKASIVDNSAAVEEKKVDQMTARWLDKKLSDHLDTMINKIITEYNIDSNKWRKVIVNSTKHAVMTIKPSSRLLNDSIDFNTFIKIVTIQHINQEKCQYVNGVVFKKNVAHRRMRTSIENPRILLLSGSLGYVQDQDNDDLIDVEAEVNQEQSFMNIIKAKITTVDPDIIFVEKDASRLALDTLLKDNRTVITNTSSKMLQMIARATQTITCPSTNLLDKNFVVGYCLNFRVESIKPVQNSGSPFTLDLSGQTALSSLTESTSLMFLEGCQAKLGCSIVLSGTELEELKEVRKALQMCLKTARVLVLEREYLRFITPDMEMFKIEDKEDDNGEPEMHNPIAFSEEQKDQHRSSRMTIVADDRSQGSSRHSVSSSENFNEYRSPYLFHKQMQRDSIVFEVFSLVTASKNEQAMMSDQGQPMPEYIAGNARSDNRDTGTSRDRTETQFTNALLDTQNKSERDKAHEVLNEANLRKKLKNMCFRPKRHNVKFYDTTSDKSLHTMIKNMAQGSFKLCQAESCQKAYLIHTDYWYHGEGCVEIKYMEDAANTSDSVRKLLSKEHPTFVYCYCNKCNSLVMQRSLVPNEMLEMSFYKLLEHFFYNPDIKIAKQGRNNSILGNNFAPQCTHSLHRDCSMIFRYGPIKIMINFEKQEEYTLDMPHFGLMEGIRTEQYTKNKIEAKLEALQFHSQSSFMLIKLSTERLLGWLQFSQEELPNLFVEQDIYETIKELTDFLKLYQQTFIKFVDMCENEVFGGKAEEEIFFQAELLKKEGAMCVQVKSLMQVNRLHKLLGARICEFIYILKRSYQLIKTDLIYKLFGKKNPFIDESTDRNPKLSAQNDMKLQQSMKEFEPQLPRSNDQTIQSKPAFNRLASDAFFDQKKTPGGDLAGPSQTLKTLYQELSNFDELIQSDQSVAYIVQQNSFLPMGFNQNATGDYYSLGKDKDSLPNYDLSAIIACALSSNLYLTALAEVDYLNLSQNLKPIDDWFKKTEIKPQQESAEDILARAALSQSREDVKNRKVEMFQDVMSDPVNVEVLEQELLRTQDHAFWFAFSTQQSAMVEVEMNKKPLHCIDNTDARNKEFYSRCEKICNMEIIEKPLDNFMFSELAQAVQLVKNLKITRNKGLSLSKRTTESKRNYRTASESDVGRPDVNDTTGMKLTTEQNNTTVTSAASGFGGRSDSIVKRLDNTGISEDISAEKARDEIYHLYHDKMEFSVKVYFPTQFEALRKLYCGSYNTFLHSIFRSDLWEDNSGGKSQSTFFKSDDNKYVCKVVQSKEIKMFEDMSFSYFEYLSRSFSQQCPTALGKTLGIYKVIVKQRNVTNQFYVLMMENLLLNIDNNVAIKYDLKGSKRNRYIANAKPSEVTLDNNFLYDYRSRPITMQYSCKRLFKIAIANDSLYLSKHSIIDYSLLAIIDPTKKTIRIGIIDYIQQYTLEKELESYVKQTLAKEEPTIIPPEQYKQRFRQAMEKYFIAAIPDRNLTSNEMLNKKYNAEAIKWVTKEQARYYAD